MCTLRPLSLGCSGKERCCVSRAACLQVAHVSEAMEKEGCLFLTSIYTASLISLAGRWALTVKKYVFRLVSQC